MRSLSNNPSKNLVWACFPIFTVQERESSNRLLEVYFVLVKHVVSTVPAYMIITCMGFYEATLTK